MADSGRCGPHLASRSPPVRTSSWRNNPSHFPGAFYSALAGFSEIGESLEDTLLREVREETGVSVCNLRYFGSQPWPSPNSLTLAFTADWCAGEIAIDPRELSDAPWFARDQLPPLPPPISIARQLINAWIAEGNLR